MQEIRAQFLGHKDPLEKGNGNPLQYSCLGNHMHSGAWWATVHGVAKETDQLNNRNRFDEYAKHLFFYIFWLGLYVPSGSDGKQSACNAGDPGSIPGLCQIPCRRK